MGARLEIWAANYERDYLQPVFLSYCLLTSNTEEAGFKKFVELRRKLGLYVNMAVITPLLLNYADKITLWDQNNIFVGKIETADSLPQLVATNLDRLNRYHPGVLRAYFPDDSMFRVSIPLDSLRVNRADPTSIEY